MAALNKSPWPDKHPQGYKTYKWQTTESVIMSGGNHECVCVSPEFPIEACSFLIVDPATGIARQLTEADVKSPQAKCDVYFTTCEICPKICREAWVLNDLSVNGNRVCLPDCPQKQLQAFLLAAGKIRLKFPTIV